MNQATKKFEIARQRSAQKQWRGKNYLHADFRQGVNVEHDTAEWAIKFCLYHMDMLEFCEAYDKKNEKTTVAGKAYYTSFILKAVDAKKFHSLKTKWARAKADRAMSELAKMEAGDIVECLCFHIRLALAND